MKRIQEDIKKGEFRKVYLLYGPERYLRLTMQQRLVKALVADGDTMNFTRFEGKNAEEGAIAAQAETMPFFAERRVILVEDTGIFKRKADELADYVKQLPDYLVLIFSEDEIDKRSRLYKAVTKAGIAVEFAEQKGETLTRWVLGMLKRENKKITRQDMDHFMDLAGTDMGRIAQELEKLFSYTEGRDVITGKDIDDICTPQVSNRIFDMVRAVAGRDQKKALGLYDDLLALKEPPMRILYLLAREFNLLWQVRQLREAGEGNPAIASRTGLPPFAVKKYIPLSMQYEKKALRSAVEDFVRTEAEVKTGRLSDRLSVELMIMKHSA